MAKQKTESDYAAAITELHQQRLEYPDSKAIIKKIDTQVRGWMRRVDIAIQVAQNEQTPWTAEMIGYQTETMPSKKSSGFAQTGDYAGVVRTSDGDRYVPVLCERKSIQDAYGTLIVSLTLTRRLFEVVVLVRREGEAGFDTPLFEPLAMQHDYVRAWRNFTSVTRRGGSHFCLTQHIPGTTGLLRMDPL